MKYAALSILFLAGCCECPPTENASEWRNKAQTLELRLSFVLDSARIAHEQALVDIANRPTVNDRINEHFTVSPNAAAARDKFRRVLLRRPEPNLYNVDTVR